MLKPVKSLNELRNLAVKDERYKKLTIISAQNLGKTTENFDVAFRWLITNADETNEEDLMGEVNFCRDLVED